MKLSKEAKILTIVALAVLLIAGGIYFFAKSSTEGKNQLGSKAADSTGLESFSYGPADAKVTVTEFFDPECESCAQVSPYIKGEMKYYEGKVRWVFRYMAYHPNSTNAIKVLEAARKQNKYLEAMTVLFERQSEWGMKHDGTDQGHSKEKELVAMVAGIPGIDQQKLVSDMQDPAILKRIEQDKIDGEAAGVTGTPTLFVNGKMVNPLSLDTMIQWIDAGLKAQ